MSVACPAAASFGPPPELRGMTRLDRERFRYASARHKPGTVGPRRTFELPVIKVPSKSIGRLLGSKPLQEYSIPKTSVLKVRFMQRLGTATSACVSLKIRASFSR